MKLLYLADIRFPMERANGIQTIETCHALARRGVEVELVVRRSDARSESDCLAFFDLEIHPNLELRRLDARGRAGFLMRSLGFLLGEADIVYTRDLLLADIARRISGAPLMYEAHTVAAVFAKERADLYGEGEPPSASKLARLDARERRVCQKAAAVVTITQALLTALETRHGPIERGIVAPDGCRVPEMMPEAPEPSDANNIYYVGQLYPWKGVDVLVRAMQHVAGARLVVVGGLPPEPDLDRVKALAAELGLGDRVHFRGFVPPAQLVRERRHAAMFVIPNLDSETARLFTSPLKLFEAMASGRPIVASDLPSIREVLTHEENSLLVPPGDASVLAAAMKKLLDDRELGVRLAKRAFEDVKAYSWDRRADTIRTAALALIERGDEF